MLTIVAEGVAVRRYVETHPPQNQSVVQSGTSSFQAHREVLEDRHDVDREGRGSPEDQDPKKTILTRRTNNIHLHKLL